MTVPRQLSLLKGPRQRGEQPVDPLEFSQQCYVASRLRWCAAPGWIWTAFPAGEWRTPATAGRVKAMGLNPGFFDLLFIDPDGVHRWLEMKRCKARLTEEQARFSLAMLARGVPAEVARSQDEAVDILGKWGALRR
jgi:hypothetical protein